LRHPRISIEQIFYEWTFILCIIEVSEILFLFIFFVNFISIVIFHRLQTMKTAHILWLVVSNNNIDIIKLYKKKKINNRACWFLFLKCLMNLQLNNKMNVVENNEKKTTIHRIATYYLMFFQNWVNYFNISTF